MSTTGQTWTRERQSQAWTARSDGHDLSGADQDDMLAEIDRAWGEIERLSKERDAEIAAGLEVHGALGAVTADRARLLRASTPVNCPGSSDGSPLARDAVCCECHKPLGAVAHADCDAPALGIVGRELGYVPPVTATPAPLTPAAIDAWADRFSSAMSGAQDTDVTARLVGEARRWLDRCAADPLATIDLAEAHVSRGRMLDMRTAPLSKAALGVVSAWDARASDGRSVPGGMLLIGNAIERLRNEVRIAPAPLTEAEAIVRAMPARYMTREEANNDYDGLHGPDLWFEGYACALREAAAILSASRGAVPAEVRPEAEPAVQTERPGAYDGAVPVRPDARPLLDQVYAIVRPFYETDEHAEGRPAASWVLEQVREAMTAPVDVPHNLRVGELSRFAGAEVGPVGGGFLTNECSEWDAPEPWTPKVGDRVVTADPLTASLAYRDEANAMRRAGAAGNVAETFVDPLGGPDDFMVRHDDGTFAPYDAAELAPEVSK